MQQKEYLCSPIFYTDGVMKNFELTHSSLTLGKHQFEYKIDEELFTFFDHHDFNSVKVDGHLDLLKEGTMLTLLFHVNGVVGVDCDRCGAEVNLDFEGDQRVFVKFSERQTDSSSEEIVYAAPNDTSINLANFWYETILLAMPLRKVHEDGECDEKALALLESLNQNDSNEIDPRWEALKKLNK